MSNSLLEKPVCYNVTLHCTTGGQCETHQLKELHPPSTVLELKIQIEKHFNVPCCVQSVLFDCHTLQDDVSLQEMRIRHDDTFRVEYLEKAKCQEITNAIQWMASVSEAIIDDSVNGGSTVINLIDSGTVDDVIDDLAYEYFLPWSDTTSLVNKLHFVHNGGVEETIKLLKLSLDVQWISDVHRQYFANVVMKLMWNFSEKFQFRRIITILDGVSLCLQALLGVKLESSSETEESSWLSHTQDAPVLKNTIFSSLGLLYTLSELPECCLEIASNEEAIEQMSIISIQDIIPVQCSECVAGIFLCLSFDKLTHPLLCKPALLNRMQRSFYMVREETENDSTTHHSSITMLRYYSLMFMAIVALVSPHYLPNMSLKGGVDREIISFIASNDYLSLRRIEIEQQSMWSTIKPYVKLLYIPNVPCGELQHVCIELIIFSLQNMLGRQNHRDILIKEGLLDYVTVAPQYVPASMKKQAKELVTMVRSYPDVPLGPPTLLNMVKAKLAKVVFGLENVLTLPVSKICFEVISAQSA